MMMLNEAARCFGEQIIRSARDGDIGAVFGIGFPAIPWRPVPVYGYYSARVKWSLSCNAWPRSTARGLHRVTTLLQMAERGPDILASKDEQLTS